MLLSVLSIYLSIFIPVVPTWSVGHPWKSVPLQFIKLRQSVGLLRRGISPTQGRYLHTEQHKLNKRTQTFIDPSARAGEDISCLRLRGHCDQQLITSCFSLLPLHLYGIAVFSSWNHYLASDIMGLCISFSPHPNGFTCTASHCLATIVSSRYVSRTACYGRDEFGVEQNVREWCARTRAKVTSYLPALSSCDVTSTSAAIYVWISFKVEQQL
jgi:hypothetical protein